MIVVDASALVAILLNEPEATTFREYLLAHPGSWLSPVGYWEAATRLAGLRGDDGVEQLDIVINSLSIRISPATANTARLATLAQHEYGKRTSARLNMGDCFAYALAREQDAVLLFKGQDFSRTDIRSALPQ